MGHVIDILNKEHLLEEIDRVVQLSIPDISTHVQKLNFKLR